jgi:hypothetical protein
MAPSNFMQLIRKAAISRYGDEATDLLLRLYGATDLLLLLIVLSTLSASLPPSALAGGGDKKGRLLFLLLSPRVSFHPCVYLCGAFVLYLMFYYPTNKKSSHSRLYLLFVLSTLPASLRPSALAGGGDNKGPLLSLLLSLRFSYSPCLYLCGAFVIYLIFYYPASKRSYHSRLYILLAALLFLPARYLPRHLLPFLFNTAIPAFVALPWRIQVGVGVSMVAPLILRPGFTFLHLVANGLILVLVLAVQSLRPFLPAALVPPTTVLSVLLFLYYLPVMPNFILSFAPIIRRTMAVILLLFLVLTPQLVGVFRLLSGLVLMGLVASQTKKVNFVVRLLHLDASIDYVDSNWFINLLTWSFFALYLICTVAKIYIHPLA